MVDTMKLKQRFKVVCDEPTIPPTQISDGPLEASERPIIDVLQGFLKNSPLLFCFIATTSSVLSTDNVMCLALPYIPQCIVGWLREDDGMWPSTEIQEKIICAGST